MSFISFTVAHLTDVHLGPVAGFGPRHWGLKRGLGYLNWLRKRRHDHQQAALDRIVADLLGHRPDHIAVTGDLVNIGLPREHIEALAWLGALGPPERVTVVPGNHDTYVRMRRDPGPRRWAAYMASNAEGLAFAGGDAEGPPFVRVLGEVALVGMDSAIPTPPLLAWGRVGRAQLARLDAILERLRGAGLFRLVLIHHPPLRGQADATRGLRDAADLESVLERRGAELVIHGHNHRNMLAWLPRGPGRAAGPPCRTAVVGAPSASLARAHGREALARYNLYRIAPRPKPTAGAWSVELVGRGLAEPGGPVVELERRELTLGPACP
ncbi:MAG TPA: metallophosphoesterase [Hyphomicrobiaceae bacterium]|jgi:3',5'-cyclic AMP phosphodiesterase CpdA